MSYDIFTDYRHPMPGEGPFFTDYLWKAKESMNIGLEYIDWKEAKYTYLYPHKDDIIEQFNLFYKYRELGAETESRFQGYLQNVFNTVADKYNHAYKVTEENDVDKLGTGYSYLETRKRLLEATGNTSTEESTDNKYKDTPSSSTSTLNNPTNQNLTDRNGSTDATTNENEEHTISRDNTKHDKEMIVELSELIDRYRQLDVEFVREFENCFMGIYFPYRLI